MKNPAGHVIPFFPLRDRRHWILAAALGALLLLQTSCSNATADGEYFGKVEPPEGQVLNYVSGSEPESLDPHIGTGQPEGRIYMSLFEGLTEYDPKTMQPIPAIAESWEPNQDLSEFTFHLRRNARWSDGNAIKAHDFVYSMRRLLSPELASRNAYLAYYIKYAQAYNEGGLFVQDQASKRYVLTHDVNASSQDPPDIRLVLPGDVAERDRALQKDAKLRSLVAGKSFVPVRSEDIGVEAIDDFTLRVTLMQSAPFFVGLTSHHSFRVVPHAAIDKFGEAWTQPGHIVTCGPFRLQSWKPYDRIVVVRDPMYWDAAKVRLDRITFNAIDETTTMMNLYKSGALDAVYNHNVPAAWIDSVRHFHDYMDAPEITIDYYMFKTTEPPMNDVRVRRAFNMAIDKVALSQYRRVTKPLTAFTPEGIFPGYPQPKGDPFDPETARRLMAEAGYKDSSGNYDPSQFPIEKVSLTYNTAESNRQVAEFVQAQWKQNLGLTVPLKNMEWKTFLAFREGLQYQGIARAGWVGDYLDPFTFLSLMYTPSGNNGTGWWSPKYVEMLDNANRTLDPKARYAALAEAEAFMLKDQPVIPLQTAATNWMKKPYVKGMYPNPGTQHPWKFVYIEHDRAKWDHGVPAMTD